MKLYQIAPVLLPNSDPFATDARLRACIVPIADTILACVSADPALFAMRHKSEASPTPVQPDTAYGNAEVVRVANAEMLRKILLECGDPFGGGWMLLRSLITCRSVVHGCDGNAFVCLLTDDPPMASPDEALIAVEECSNLLTETDWLDGLLPDD